MTPDAELDQIEARCKAATPGPWVTEPRNPRIVYSLANGRGIAVAQEHQDSPLIAHARTDLPRLVAEVRGLRAALRKLRGLLP